MKMQMKSSLAFVAAAMLVATPGAAATGKWQRIFDGRTLKGWTPKFSGHPAGVNVRDTFVVRNGAIRVSYAKYKSFDGLFGHLAYKRPYSAFRIRFDYRIFGKVLPKVEPWQHSNSGLMFLAQSPESMARDQKFPVSMEMQLLGAERPEPSPTGNLCTPGTNVVMNGKLETTHCILSTSPIIPNGRWVHAEVEVTRDGKVTHFIDGRAVIRYSAPQYDPTDAEAKPLIAAAGGKLAIGGGYFYLQAEGHPLEFRNIEVMELK
jgi:3-keto-disaccharide hydrolase